MVLEHFDVTTHDYAVVFTANATGALQTVASCFVFGGKSTSTPQIASSFRGKGLWNGISIITKLIHLIVIKVYIITRKPLNSRLFQR